MKSKALRALALVAALFLVYKVARLAANGHVDEAFRNAQLIWDAERALHLPGELAVQQAHHRVATGSGQQGPELVTQAVRVVAAQLRADGGLGPRLQAQVHQAVEILRDRYAHLHTGTHVGEPPSFG